MDFIPKCNNSFGSLLSCTHYSTVFPELAVTVNSTSTLKIAAKSTGIILSKDRGMAWPCTGIKSGPSCAVLK